MRGSGASPSPDSTWCSRTGGWPRPSPARAAPGFSSNSRSDAMTEPSQAIRLTIPRPAADIVKGFQGLAALVATTSFAARLDPPLTRFVFLYDLLGPVAVFYMDFCLAGRDGDPD